MTEVTDLQVLANMSNGTPNEDDAFIIRDPKNGESKYKIHSLHELVDILASIPTEEIFPTLCRIDEGDYESDVALWIHYVLGDAVLSAKMLNLVKEYHSDPEKLRIEVFNLCFNRYLNFQEVTLYSDDIISLNDEKNPPADL